MIFEDFLQGTVIEELLIRRREQARGRGPCFHKFGAGRGMAACI
jgi:hypothetical protein